MATVIPRLFRKSEQLVNLSGERAFGVEFRINNDITRYNVIATSHILVFVLSGEKCIHCEDGDIVVERDSLVFIPKGSYIFSDIKSSDNCFHRLIFFLEDSFLLDFLQSIPCSPESPESGEPSDAIVSLPMSDQLCNAVESIQPYLDSSLSYGDSLLKMKLHEILLNILESDSEKRVLSSLVRAVSSPKSDLRNFMETHFADPLTVTEFAQLCCRSPRQFNRDFSTVFHTTPREWLHAKRLELAHSLLCTSDKSVTEICHQSGFQNYSNFIQQFRKRFSITQKKLQMQRTMKIVS